ncbi:MAG: hypothetical protein MJZ69_11310 [Bacteroidaceae bacterium]|nr:hypothetical protein [Bacteroidaceae bacterium]
MQSSTSIIGTWRIDNWLDGGGYYEFCFKEDGTGYEECQEYSGKQVEHWDISYKVREGKITIYYGEDEDWWDWTLDFDISIDGKILTIYGMDDDDMKVMKFKRK